MTDPPILEVSFGQSGTIDYRIRTCHLSTAEYGQIMANVVQQIGEMMHREGGFDQLQVVTQIVLYMMRVLGEQANQMQPDLHLLQ